MRICVTKMYPHYTGHPHYIKTGHDRGVYIVSNDFTRTISDTRTIWSALYRATYWSYNGGRRPIYPSWGHTPSNTRGRSITHSLPRWGSTKMFDLTTGLFFFVLRYNASLAQNIGVNFNLQHLLNRLHQGLDHVVCCFLCNHARWRTCS